MQKFTFIRKQTRPMTASVVISNLTSDLTYFSKRCPNLIECLICFWSPSTPYIRMTNHIFNERKRRPRGICQCCVVGNRGNEGYFNYTALQANKVFSEWEYQSGSYSVIGHKLLIFGKVYSLDMERLHESPRIFHPAKGTNSQTIVNTASHFLIHNMLHR